MTISRAEEAITEVLGYPKNIPGLVQIRWYTSDSEPTCSGDHGGLKSCGWVSSDCTVVISQHAYVSWFTDNFRDRDNACSTCGAHILAVTPSSPACCLCFLQSVCPRCQIHLPGLRYFSQKNVLMKPNRVGLSKSYRLYPNVHAVDRSLIGYVCCA